MSGISLDWYWIAGRTPDEPGKKKGLGVCIIEAAGPYHAIAKAKDLGVFPGGEFKIWRVPAPPSKYRHRHLSQEEAKECDLAMKEARN